MAATGDFFRNEQILLDYPKLSHFEISQIVYNYIVRMNFYRDSLKINFKV